MSIASAMGEGGSKNPQWDLALRVSPYRVEFETMPDKAFFRVGRHRRCTGTLPQHNPPLL